MLWLSVALSWTTTDILFIYFNFSALQATMPQNHPYNKLVQEQTQINHYSALNFLTLLHSEVVGPPPCLICRQTCPTQSKYRIFALFATTCWVCICSIPQDYLIHGLHRIYPVFLFSPQGLDHVSNGHFQRSSGRIRSRPALSRVLFRTAFAHHIAEAGHQWPCTAVSKFAQARRRGRLGHTMKASSRS